jgi:hypothetical protein
LAKIYSVEEVKLGLKGGAFASEVIKLSRVGGDVDEKRVRQFNLEYGIASDRTATRD